MDFIEFHKIISKTKIKHWRDVLPRSFGQFSHCDLKLWLKIFEYLPEIQPGEIDLAQDKIRIGNKSGLTNIPLKKTSSMAQRAF